MKSKYEETLKVVDLMNEIDEHINHHIANKHLDKPLHVAGLGAGLREAREVINRAVKRELKKVVA